MKKIIILVAGGSGYDVVSIIDAINNISDTWEILGFLDDNPSLLNRTIFGYYVMGDISQARKYDDVLFISSIANPKDRLVRRRVWDRVKSFGGQFANLVH